jgi:long-chain acyl-CoA synthetase
MSVLIAPDFVSLEALAKEKGIAFASRAELIEHAEVRAEYQALLKKVNENLANFETLKRFALVPDEWSIATGEMTPTMKLKRRVVVERYAQQIAGLYNDEASAHR